MRRARGAPEVKNATLFRELYKQKSDTEGGTGKCSWHAFASVQCLVATIWSATNTWTTTCRLSGKSPHNHHGEWSLLTHLRINWSFHPKLVSAYYNQFSLGPIEFWWIPWYLAAPRPARQMHLAAMRELVAATSQQIQEREAATWLCWSLLELVVDFVGVSSGNNERTWRKQNDDDDDDDDGDDDDDDDDEDETTWE